MAILLMWWIASPAITRLSVITPISNIVQNVNGFDSKRLVIVKIQSVKNPCLFTNTERQNIVMGPAGPLHAGSGKRDYPVEMISSFFISSATSLAIAM